jgi:hypothetical protein
LAGYASTLWCISDRLARAEAMAERRNLEPNPCIRSKKAYAIGKLSLETIGVDSIDSKNGKFAR